MIGTSLTCQFATQEYLISEYGTQLQASPANRINDLYCWFPFICGANYSLTLLTGLHYSEGTLMPLLLNKYIFTLVPRRAPLFLRPIVNVVFKQLQDKFVDPRLKQNGDLVRIIFSCV